MHTLPDIAYWENPQTVQNFHIFDWVCGVLKIIKLAWSETIF